MDNAACRRILGTPAGHGPDGTGATWVPAC
jgi:hypothetical protein